MVIVDAALSALINLIVLFVIPFVIYAVYQKRRHQRTLTELSPRLGLIFGDLRYAGYSVIVAMIVVAFIVVRPPPVEPFMREGSAQHSFVGLGISVPAIVMALLYGVVQTGFSEEFFFRGLIAGSLGRRMRLQWANLLQTLIFLAPHLVLLSIMPEMWWILILVIAGSLFTGWVRIRSGSILGPWIVHASVNVTMALSVAARSGA